MMGSDLIPNLIEWDEGQKLIDEIRFIVFERKGFEHILDESIPKSYQMPKHYVALRAGQNLVGMISSTEVRRRIREAKLTYAHLHTKQVSDGPSSAGVQSGSEEEGQEPGLSATYFYEIGGLVTKNTIEYIRENKLY